MSRNYHEFPRVVYGPDGATKTIRSEDERPDGFFNTPDEQKANYTDDYAKAAEAAEAAQQRDYAKKVLEAEGVKYSNAAHTETLEKRVAEIEPEKARICKVLDENGVNYAADLNLAGLTELYGKLMEHMQAKTQEG